MENLVRTFTESNPPLGFTAAAGTVAAATPTVQDIREGNFDTSGWSAAGQRRNSQAGLERTLSDQTSRRRRSTVASSQREPNSPVSPGGIAPIVEGVPQDEKTILPVIEEPSPTNGSASAGIASSSSAETPHPNAPHDPSVPYPNGYQFPPQKSTWKSIQIGLISFGKFAITPIGFFITIYGLNVVAWGGMLFLILVGAARAMCYPDCNAINSPAKIWLEITSQILNALFCVTGLGLIPWRFRDLYYLMQFRLQKKESGIRRLAGLHNDWFRLIGSQDLPIDFHPKEEGAAISLPSDVTESALAIPITFTPNAPLTGERAPPSMYWKMDFIIWCYVWNTLLQICLCGIMWGLTRYTRPGWATGLLISLAFIVAGAGGIMGFLEGKKVKKIEGVPVSEEDLEILRRRREEEIFGPPTEIKV